MADGVVIEAPTVEDALRQLLRIASESGDLDLLNVRLGPWAATHVEIKGPIDSAITPPFMEAFLEAQKQLYQFAALAKSGVADTKQLTDAERAELEIQVHVTSGSSNLETDYRDVFEKALTTMLRKLSGKQAAIVLLGAALLFAGTWGWTSYLEVEKDVKLEELRGKDRAEALQAMRFATAEQMDAFRRVIAALEKQGQLGERAIEMAQATNEALLRAATKTERTVINEQALTSDQAELLRATPRQTPTRRFSLQQVRVVDINTADEADVQIVLMDQGTKDQYRLRLAETLFSKIDKELLFRSLAARTYIWVELMFREVGNEVRSTEFLRVRPDLEVDPTEPRSIH